MAIKFYLPSSDYKYGRVRGNTLKFNAKNRMVYLSTGTIQRFDLENKKLEDRRMFFAEDNGQLYVGFGKGFAVTVNKHSKTSTSTSGQVSLTGDIISRTGYDKYLILDKARKIEGETLYPLSEIATNEDKNGKEKES